MTREGERPPNRGRRVCRFFLQNRCRFGDNCRFLHTLPDSRLPQPGNASGTRDGTGPIAFGPIFGIEIDSRSTISDPPVEDVTVSVQNVENATDNSIQSNLIESEAESAPGSPEIPGIGLNDQLHRHFATLNGYVSPWVAEEEEDTQFSDSDDFSFGSPAYWGEFDGELIDLTQGTETQSGVSDGSSGMEEGFGTGDGVFRLLFGGERTVANPRQPNNAPSNASENLTSQEIKSFMTRLTQSHDTQSNKIAELEAENERLRELTDSSSENERPCMLKCGVCLETKKAADFSINTPCGHCFCQNCNTRWKDTWNATGDGRRFKCPTCRKRIQTQTRIFI